jgi:hypothetical protein
LSFQNLKWIDLINDLILEGAFQPDFLANFDIPQPVRIPKAFASEPDRPYHIPMAWRGTRAGIPCRTGAARRDCWRRAGGSKRRSASPDVEWREMHTRPE